MTRLFSVLSLILVLITPLSVEAQAAKSAPIADKIVTNAATLILIGNAFRTSLSCTNHTVAVRWGNSTVTATVGQRIPAGASAEINNQDSIYMISEGADSTVSCTEETR